MKLKVQKATSEHVIGEGAVRNFIYQCVFDLKIGLGFHPDTPFEDYANSDTDKAVFSSEESEELNKTLDECFKQCEKEGLDIYELSLQIMQPLLEKI